MWIFHKIVEDIPVEVLVFSISFLLVALRDRIKFSRILRNLGLRDVSQETVSAELVVLKPTARGPAFLIREMDFCRTLVSFFSIQQIKILSEYASRSSIADARIIGHFKSPKKGQDAAMKTIYHVLFRCFKAAMEGQSSGKRAWYYCIPTNFADSKQLKVLRYLVVPKAFMESLAEDNFWWTNLLVEKQDHYEHLLALRSIAIKLKANNWNLMGVQLLQYGLPSNFDINPVRPPSYINWMMEHVRKIAFRHALDYCRFPKRKRELVA